MIKTKFRSKVIFALSIVLALILSLAIGTLMPSSKASAATSYSPSTIFSAGTGGKVGASEGDEKYVQFTLSDGGAVYFRRDLALKWYEPAKSGEANEGEEKIADTLANPGEVKYLKLGFSFSELNFETFSLVFEGAEENISKDNTATNSVVFKNDNGTVKVAVKNASEQDNDDWNEEGVAVDVSDGVVFTIDEKDCHIGEFAVYVNDTFVGKLTNIGGYYLEYLSSASDTPRVPVAFTLDKLAEGKDSQVMLVKELNGQSLKLSSDGKVEDNAAPVLVLNEKVYAYTLGKQWSLSYEAIDVCDTSVTVSRYYYMLKKKDDKYVKAESGDYSSLTTSTFLLPSDDKADEEQYVSIRFQLTDDAGVKNDEGYIYLSWYAADNAVATMGEGDDAFDYIRVNRNVVGPYYIGVTPNDETKENDVSAETETAIEEYAKAVEEVAKDLSAGDGSYYYMPSLRGLIGSDHADYRNLTFSVYYHKQSQASGATASSATSLKYNALKFEIDEVGKYLFCVLAKDASGNAMKYYVDGKLVEVTSNNIWDIDAIPKFSFEVSYSGATVEDPGEQSLGYRDSTYTVKSFDIVALSGYETEYKLYYLDEAAMQYDGVKAPYSSYSDLVENINDYHEVLKKYLVNINEYNDEVSKDDDAWDRTDNDYHWYPGSLSFVPVEVGYYLVELTVTESSLPGSVVKAYQVIDVRNPIDSPPDVSQWLQNNVVAVILFSISAILLIIIIILAVVKPADKAVDEIDLEKLKKMEKRKKGVMKGLEASKKNDDSDEKDK